MTSAQSWVEVLLNRRAEACREKNIDRLMSLYSSDIVYFDGPIGLETRDQRIAVDGHVAFVHMLHIDKGNVHFAKAGLEEAWVRSTVCCRRVKDEWLITHEHISWPFEFNTEGGRAVMTP